jgi:hypothetical protein
MPSHRPSMQHIVQHDVLKLLTLLNWKRFLNRRSHVRVMPGSPTPYNKSNRIRCFFHVLASPPASVPPADRRQSGFRPNVQAWETRQGSATIKNDGATGHEIEFGLAEPRDHLCNLGFGHQPSQRRARDGGSLLVFHRIGAAEPSGERGYHLQRLPMIDSVFCQPTRYSSSHVLLAFLQI